MLCSLRLLTFYFTDVFILVYSLLFYTESLTLLSCVCQLFLKNTMINSDDRRSELPVSANCNTLSSSPILFITEDFSSGMFSRILFTCCRKCVTATSLINCVTRKHLKFYQHEQKDSVNHSYRIAAVDSARGLNWGRSRGISAPPPLI